MESSGVGLPFGGIGRVEGSALRGCLGFDPGECLLTIGRVDLPLGGIGIVE